jgi:hypothetical protein
MRIIAYVGPSVSVADARRILDVEYVAPVRSLDLLRAIDSGPVDAFVIIDGLFEQVAAVRHKEILYALSIGIPVYGASSMGALRAAELAAFGMVGVGQVFESFRTGELTDDDEVAISHAAAELAFKPLSDAMVNIRDGLARAEQEGIVDKPQRTRLIALGKALFYADRSWPALFARATKQGMDPAVISRLSQFVSKIRPDLKRDDAMEVLRRVANDFADGKKPKPLVDFDFECTRHFQDVFLASARHMNVLARRSSADVSGEELALHVRVWGSPYRDEIKHAVLSHFAAAQLHADELERDEEALAESAERLAPFSFQQEWIRDTVATVPKALDMYDWGAKADMADAHVVLSIATDDRIRLFHDALAERSRCLATAGLTAPSLATSNIAEGDLLRWLSQRRPDLEADSFSDLAEALGIRNTDALIAEILSQFLYEKQK